MNTFNIIADSPQEAITKARETFGPEAVIQEVRKQPRKGFSRLWKQPRLELVVEVPAPTSKLPKKEKFGPESSSFFDVYKKQTDPEEEDLKANLETALHNTDLNDVPKNKWRVEPMLRRMGLSDYWVDQLLDRLALRFKGRIS